MSWRVRYAMVVAVLAGTHWSYLPLLKALWPPAQSWLRSWTNCMPRSFTWGRNGSTSFLLLSVWCHTDWPLGRVTGRGSPKPRTPFMAPK